MSLSREKIKQLERRMEALGINDEDLEERFIRGSGKGGQKINNTASCVYLKHVPSGIEIKCQQDRSQVMNRFLARREVCDQLEEKQLGEKSRRRMEAEKIRRQKRRRSRRSKARMLADKNHQGTKKKLRGRVRQEEDCGRVFFAQNRHRCLPARTEGFISYLPGWKRTRCLRNRKGSRYRRPSRRVASHPVGIALSIVGRGDGKPR